MFVHTLCRNALPRGMLMMAPSKRCLRMAAMLLNEQQQQQQQQQQKTSGAADTSQLKPLPPPCVDLKKPLVGDAKAMMAKSAEEIDANAKKLGWIVSGSAIALISALFGKVYMLLGAVPLCMYHARDLNVMSKTFNRDVMFLWRHAKCWLLGKRIKNDNLTLPTVFQATARRNADRTMLQMQDQNWKYKDVASYANRTSRLMQKYGFQKGDVVAMYTLNSPEMIAIILGLANIGIVTALINTDLRGDGLTRALANSHCKGIIFDDVLMHAFEDVYKKFSTAIIFQMRHKAKCPEFHVLEEELLKEYNDQPEMFVNIHHEDPLLKTYASDDALDSEPMVVSHEKFLFDAGAIALMLDVKASDKIYAPTPLHELAGMVMGIGPSITNGVSTVLRAKFSAADYFRECYVYNCTVGQYSGTMCKQMLLSPVSPIETFHPVKAMYGSGLECDYWQEFVNRFGTKMYEVHGVSQESMNLINMEGKIGVVGFRPKLAPSFMFPHFVIKVFGQEKIPVRDAKGFCQLCEYNEPGLLVRVWSGSASPPMKARKIQNVFKHGDFAITNGEILTIDEHLYLRPIVKATDKSWVSKLVTSEEVEYIASKLTSKRCSAYSLHLDYKQNIDILAIEDPANSLNMKKFTDELVEHLPKNWVPHYVRIVNAFELVDGGKVDKAKLIAQGLNMEGNLVYYFDQTCKTYKPLLWAKNEAAARPPHVRVHELQLHELELVSGAMLCVEEERRRRQQAQTTAKKATPTAPKVEPTNEKIANKPSPTGIGMMKTTEELSMKVAGSQPKVEKLHTDSNDIISSHHIVNCHPTQPTKLVREKLARPKVGVVIIKPIGEKDRKSPAAAGPTKVQSVEVKPVEVKSTTETASKESTKQIWRMFVRNPSTILPPSTPNAESTPPKAAETAPNTPLVQKSTATVIAPALHFTEEVKTKDQAKDADKVSVKKDDRGDDGAKP